MAKFVTSAREGFDASDVCGIKLIQMLESKHSYKVEFTTHHGKVYECRSMRELTINDAGNILGLVEIHPDYAVEWQEVEDMYFS